MASVAIPSILSVRSTLIKTNDIRTVLDHIEPGAQPLTLSDFDDTLVWTGSPKASHLGGIKWREDLRNTIAALKGKITPNAPLFECLTLFIAKSLPPRAVQYHKNGESETARSIAKLDARGQCMVFTSRGRSGEKAWYGLNVTGVDAFTKEQMQRAGIDINIDKMPIPCNHPSVFENTMIFSQNTPKEQLLTDLLRKKVFDFSASPRVVLVFIDDKEDTVKKVCKTAEEHQLPCLGVHYTRVHEIEAKEYDLLRSTVQLANLLAKQVLLAPQEVDAKCAEIGELGIAPEDLFKQTLIDLDQQLFNNQVYDRVGVGVETLFEKIRQAVSIRI